jgi:16S rRNA processing protein RimM
MTGHAGPPSTSRAATANSSSQPPQQQIRYLAVGRLVRAHGLHGEVSMTVLTDFPERFEVTRQFYLGNEFEATPYLLESYRWHKKNILLKLAGVTTRDQAEQLRNLYVQVPLEAAMPLPDGSFYLYELIGMTVLTTGGQTLGTIVEVLETGANDVYVVADAAQRKILLPAIDEVVQSVDLEKRAVIVTLIDGLI